MSKRVINFFGYSDLVSFQVFQFCIPRGVLNLISTYLFTILSRHSLYYLNLGRLVIQTMVHLREIQVTIWLGSISEPSRLCITVGWALVTHSSSHNYHPLFFHHYHFHTHTFLYTTDINVIISKKVPCGITLLNLINSRIVYHNSWIDRISFELCLQKTDRIFCLW